MRRRTKEPDGEATLMRALAQLVDAATTIRTTPTARVRYLEPERRAFASVQLRGVLEIVLAELLDVAESSLRRPC